MIAALPGTLAWFNSSASMPGAVIKAGNFRVTMTNTAGQSVDMPTTLSLGDTAPLFPGQSVFTRVTVTNNGDVSGVRGNVTLDQVTQPYTTDNAAIRQYLSIAVAANQPVSTNCANIPAGSYVDLGLIANTNGTAINSDVPSSTLPIGTSVAACLRITLATNAPGTVQGQNVLVTVPLRAEQAG